MDDKYLADKFINTSTFYRFILYTVILHRACPFTSIQTAFLGGLNQNTWSDILEVGSLTQGSILERWVHNCTSWTWNEKFRAPKERIYQGTHMQTHIYNSDDCNLLYRRSHTAVKKTNKERNREVRTIAKILLQISRSGSKQV